MAINEFKPFAATADANVQDQADYEQSEIIRAGFRTGLARSAEVNKAIRQATSITAAVAEFTAEKSGKDMRDDGNIAALKANFETALSAVSSLLIAEADGTSDALTASFTPTIGALKNGMLVHVRAADSNKTKTPTFRADETEAKAVVKGNNLSLADGDIAGAGHWLEMQYDEALDKWVLQNPAKGIILQQSGVPVGTIEYFAMATPPAGYLKADGAAVGRDTYQELFAAIGTQFGQGDGGTTFNLPDLRGEFIRGWDNGRNADADRIFGSAQEDAIRNITGTISAGFADASTANEGAFCNAVQTGAYGYGSSTHFKSDFDASRVVPTAAENRPRNIALLACIKAFDTVTNPGLIDVTELANEVSGKADRNLSNVMPSGIDTCVRWGIPDYKRKVSLSESDFPYTVGKPGLFTLGTGGGNNDKVYVNDDLVFYTYVNEAYGMSNGCFVDSGDVLTISLSGAGGRNFNFYPFKGVK